MAKFVAKLVVQEQWQKSTTGPEHANVIAKKRVQNIEFVKNFKQNTKRKNFLGRLTEIKQTLQGIKPSKNDDCR